MSTDPTPPVADSQPALGLLDLLGCQHKGQQLPIPLYVVDRLRGLDLWDCTDPPETAQHHCDSRRGCMVVIGHSDHLVGLGAVDWRLVVDREGDATRGIVVQDHTQARAQRRPGGSP